MTALDWTGLGRENVVFLKTSGYPVVFIRNQDPLSQLRLYARDFSKRFSKEKKNGAHEARTYRSGKSAANRTKNNRDVKKRSFTWFVELIRNQNVRG